MSTSEWATALAECVASERLSVLRDDIVLIYVDRRKVFHPLVVLLLTAVSGSGQTDAFTSAPCVLVMRLHPRATALAREAQAQCLQRPSLHYSQFVVDVLERIVLSECCESVETENEPTPPLQMTPLGYRRAVNLAGGALFALTRSEAEAKVVLADITSAIQCSLLDGSDPSGDAQDPVLQALDGKPLLILIEHVEGYVGQRYSHGQVDTILRVEKRDFPGDDSELACDAVVGEYEMDYRDQLEMAGESPDQLRPEALRISVRAGYNTWASLHHGDANATLKDDDVGLVSGADGSCFHELGVDRIVARDQAFAQVFASWDGIENVQAFYSKPPPGSSSVVCFRRRHINQSHRSDAVRSSVSGDHAIARPHSAFPRHLRCTLQLLYDLQQSANDESYAWSSAMLSAASSYNGDDAGEIQRLFRAFLANPDDVLLLGGDDPKNTNDLSISVTIDRPVFASATTGMDFLEKLWEFLLLSARSMQSAVLIAQELVAAIEAQEITLSQIHRSNETWLARFARECSSSRDNGDEVDANTNDSSRELLMDHVKLLEALVDLGRWRLRRDLESWLLHLGLAAHEYEAIASYAQQSDVSDSGQLESVLFLVDACALAHSLGLSGSLLRRLASDISSTLPRLQHESMVSSASRRLALLPLGSFLPDGLLTSLQDPFVWDLHISLGDRLERTVRVCDSNFHTKCNTLTPATSSSSASASDDFNTDDTNMDEDVDMDPAPGRLKLDAHTISSLRRGLPAELLEMPVMRTLFADSKTLTEESGGRRKEAAKQAGHGTLVMYDCSLRRLR